MDYSYQFGLIVGLIYLFIFKLMNELDFVQKYKTGLCFQDVLKKGTGGWKKVVAAFGKEILQANGEVDRAQLGQIVFSDPAKRQILNRYSLSFLFFFFFF